MKKYILHLATLLLLGTGLLSASCGSDDPGDESKPFTPNFPATVTPTIEAGETYTLDIEPNGQWEITIPTTGEITKWFWIQDGSQKVYTQSGSQGKRSVVIATNSEIDYNTAHNCEVTLKIKGTNGKWTEKVIATITIDKVERAISVYACQFKDGDFAFNPDRADDTDLTYLYETEATEEIELIWPIGKNGYMMPIMIEGNFDWTIRGSLPAWLSDMKVSSGKNGAKTELRLEANAQNLPLDGGSAEITIGDTDTTFPITVTVPPCRSLFMPEFPAKSIFNVAGEVYNASNNNYTAGASYGTIISGPNLKLIVFAEVYNMMGQMELQYEAPHINWITPKDLWATADGVAQSRRVEVSAAANTGDPRKAYVIAIPPSILGNQEPYQLLEGNKIKEEYKPYLITTMEQAGAPGPIKASADAAALKTVGAELVKVAKYDPLKWLMNEFDTPNVYKLTYTKDWSHEDWNLVFGESVTVAKTVILNESGDNFVETGTEWLSYTPASKTIIMGNPTLGRKSGAIKFLDASDNVIGAIYCLRDKDAVIGEPEQALGFKTPDNVQNATLETVTSGTIFDDYKEYNCPIHNLTYNGQPTMAQLVTPDYSSAMPRPIDLSWLSFEGSASSFQVNMNTTEAKQGAIYFYKSSGQVGLILVCTYQPK